jgi:cobalt-zinc-cadmium efflux system outer membrane protein
VEPAPDRPPEPEGELTLDEAVSLALRYSPELRVAAWDIRAAEERAVQAGLFPNPEFDVELENFGGTGDLRGLNISETTFLVSQPLPLSGRRGRAVRVAALEADLAAWDREARRIELITEVRRAFVRALASQERVELDEELVGLSRRLVESVRRRVEGGKDSPAELSRAQVGLSTAEMALSRARRELEAARRRLAATWGGTTASFGALVGELGVLRPLPPLGDLEPLLERNPRLARFDTELEHRESVIALEDARRLPDPTLGGGIRRLNESDDNAFVLTLSVPLPLTDRNQGGRQEARIGLERTLRQREAERVRLRAELNRIYQEARSGFEEATALRDRIIVDAARAYDVIREGYRMGRFDFLDVLDARRTLFEAREQLVRAQAEYHRSVARLEGLVAQDLDAAP